MTIADLGDDAVNLALDVERAADGAVCGLKDPPTLLGHLRDMAVAGGGDALPDSLENVLFGYSDVGRVTGGVDQTLPGVAHLRDEPLVVHEFTVSHGCDGQKGVGVPEEPGEGKGGRPGYKVPRLAEHRKAKRWTQRQLADAADVARWTIAAVERGARGASLELVRRLEDIFQVSAEQLGVVGLPPRARSGDDAVVDDPQVQAGRDDGAEE